MFSTTKYGILSGNSKKWNPNVVSGNLSYQNRFFNEYPMPKAKA